MFTHQFECLASQLTRVCRGSRRLLTPATRRAASGRRRPASAAWHLRRGFASAAAGVVSSAAGRRARHMHAPLTTPRRKKVMNAYKISKHDQCTVRSTEACNVATKPRGGYDGVLKLLWSLRAPGRWAVSTGVMPSPQTSARPHTCATTAGHVSQVSTQPSAPHVARYRGEFVRRHSIRCTDFMVEATDRKGLPTESVPEV